MVFDHERDHRRAGRPWFPSRRRSVACHRRCISGWRRPGRVRQRGGNWGV